MLEGLTVPSTGAPRRILLGYGVFGRTLLAQLVSQSRLGFDSAALINNISPTEATAHEKLFYAGTLRHSARGRWRITAMIRRSVPGTQTV